GRRILRTVKVTLRNPDGSPKYLLGISEDITDLKQAESMMDEQRKLLVQSSKMSALGQMSAGIAHEINNPLAIIAGHAEEMSELATRADIAPESLREISRKIVRTVSRISHVVKGLRSFARDTAMDGFETKLVSEIMEEAFALCRQRFENEGVTIKTLAFP